MVPFEAFQDVSCSYPISGQYGIAPRFLYYTLLLFVILLRRQDWLAAGAAASCLTYGGSAAIHSIILTSIGNAGHTTIPDSAVQLPNGNFSQQLHPIVYDEDYLATWAIIGTGFLIVMPMAIWSSQFRLTAARHILVLWILLMTVGLISSLVGFWNLPEKHHQYRFCSPGYDDSPPYNTNPVSIFNNSWNESIWAYFLDDQKPVPVCIYPCVNAKEMLRQAGDVLVFHSDNSDFSGLAASIHLVMTILMLLGLHISTVLSTILFVLRMRGHNLNWWDRTKAQGGWIQKHAWNVVVGSIKFYGKFVSPVLFILFVSSIEWFLLTNYAESEPIQLVGQWSPLVGVALVLIAALVGEYSGSVSNLYREMRERQRSKRINRRGGIVQRLTEFFGKRKSCPIDSSQEDIEFVPLSLADADAVYSVDRGYRGSIRTGVQENKEPNEKIKIARTFERLPA